MICDWEAAERSAFETTWHYVTLLGCLFHLSQVIFKILNVSNLLETFIKLKSHELPNHTPTHQLENSKFK